MVQVDVLEARFRELWERLGAEDGYKSTFDEIVKKYSESQRHYHNLNHISECLKLLEQYRNCAGNPTLVEAAIWFHDIIYDTHRNENEEKSAEYAAETLRKSNVDEETVEKISSLINATKHNQPPKDNDTSLLLDIDLEVLGSPEKEFNRYETQIREEYSWVPHDRYRDGRTKILKGFLSRNPIYQTECIRDRFEEQARKNLKTSIRKLGLLQIG